MRYSLRYTDEALHDLGRIYDFLIEIDTGLADRGYDAIQRAIRILEEFPFSCRKADEDNSLLRELLVSFGSSGYVVLFKIEDNETVYVMAVRHQREDDYH